MSQESCMRNFSIVSLSSRPEPRSHKISMERRTEATRKDPDPQKKFRRPHLTSLTCVPNFRTTSRPEVPQLKKPNDPSKATFGHVCFRIKYTQQLMKFEFKYEEEIFLCFHWYKLNLTQWQIFMPILHFSAFNIAIHCSDVVLYFTVVYSKEIDSFV